MLWFGYSSSPTGAHVGSLVARVPGLRGGSISLHMGQHYFCAPRGILVAMFNNYIDKLVCHIQSHVQVPVTGPSSLCTLLLMLEMRAMPYGPYAKLSFILFLLCHTQHISKWTMSQLNSNYRSFIHG